MFPNWSLGTRNKFPVCSFFLLERKSKRKTRPLSLIIRVPSPLAAASGYQYNAQSSEGAVAISTIGLLPIPRRYSNCYRRFTASLMRIQPSCRKTKSTAFQIVVHCVMVSFVAFEMSLIQRIISGNDSHKMGL